MTSASTVKSGILDWDGDPYREFRLAVPVDAPGGRIAYEVPMGVVEVGKSEIPGTGGPAYGNLNYDEQCSEIRPREVQNFIERQRRGVRGDADDERRRQRLPGPDARTRRHIPFCSPSCWRRGGAATARATGTSRRATIATASRSIPTTAAGPTAGGAGIEANVAVFRGRRPRPGRKNPICRRAGLSSRSPRPNGLVSTIKKCADDDSVVVRFYEIEGRPAEVAIDSTFPMAGAEAVNIIEDEPRPLPFDGKTLNIRLGHQAIETVKLRPVLNSQK